MASSHEKRDRERKKERERGTRREARDSTRQRSKTGLTSASHALRLRTVIDAD